MADRKHGPARSQRCAAPDWDRIVADDAESDSWQVDRARKFEGIRIESAALLATATKLKERKALYRCSVGVLFEEAGAVEYYVSLAAYSLKTLRNSAARWQKYGLMISPERLGERLRTEPSRVPREQLEAFCKWVNAEIGELIGSDLEDDALYPIHVAMIIGPRIVGRGQNVGGDLAVAVLKKCLVDLFPPRQVWEYWVDDVWEPATTSLESALKASRLRHRPFDTVFDFTPGGNRPDVIVTRSGRVTMAGEVKGRKDESNLWESWMPQVTDHLRGWRKEHSNALLGVFMTVVTQEAIEGISRRGTRHVGLRELHEEGTLDYAYNLAELAKPYSPRTHDGFKKMLLVAMQSAS